MAFFRLRVPGLAIFLLGCTLLSCVRPSRRTENIAYLPADTPRFSAERHRLDVYAPRRASAKRRPVVVFIHGGNWNSGRKDTYWFVGRRLAKQGVVAVIPNYRLSPAARVPAMADDCARAVRWAVQHITDYGGDPQRIFVMGHSAGGGLAALLATETRFFAQLSLPGNPVKGAILDDPAGLDMVNYLTKQEYPGDAQYLVPFGTDPEGWRAVSPLFHVTASTPPLLLYVGDRTYSSIRTSSEAFVERLKTVGVAHTFKRIPGKSHVGMATQLFWKRNVIYRDLLKMVGAE